MTYFDQIAAAENHLNAARESLNAEIGWAHHEASRLIHLTARVTRSFEGTYREDESVQLDEQVRFVTAAAANVSATSSDSPAVLRQLAHTLNLFKMSIKVLDRMVNEAIAA